ncbi:hypothetical protein PRUPE_7G139400 [Prunus persica]|uniref:Uncharacterized protein n=1 Tax=Prunus persica TaxID=3760 RepID=A0A251NBA9_PRUPE|nr:hypothetical protein PRUPE_7G139400 [Prunus persica]
MNATVKLCCVWIILFACIIRRTKNFMRNCFDFITEINVFKGMCRCVLELGESKLPQYL